MAELNPCRSASEESSHPVLLEFQFDPAALADDRSVSDLRYVDASLLSFSYFEMPVRFSVAGVELLARPPRVVSSRHPTVVQVIHVDLDGVGTMRQHEQESPAQPPDLSVQPWTESALLGFAMFARSALKRAQVEGRANYMEADAGWSLGFEVDGNDVIVESSVSGLVARVGYASLVQAFDVFAEKVRVTLAEACPELREHPYWGDWFQGVQRPWFNGDAPHPWPR
jgi:hypothetical protein